MEILSNKIATAIKRTNPEHTHSVEVMQYSLSIILNTMLIIVMTAIIGWITGHLSDSLAFLVSFSVLRLFSGGFHFKTARACNIVSVLLSTFIPQWLNFSEQPILIINSFSLFIMFVFAPNPDKNAHIPSKLYPFLKLISILLVSSNFFIASSVIGLAFFVQSLTVIPWKRRIR